MKKTMTAEALTTTTAATRTSNRRSGGASNTCIVIAAKDVLDVSSTGGPSSSRRDGPQPRRFVMPTFASVAVALTLTLTLGGHRGGTAALAFRPAATRFSRRQARPATISKFSPTVLLPRLNPTERGRIAPLNAVGGDDGDENGTSEVNQDIGRSKAENDNTKDDDLVTEMKTVVTETDDESSKKYNPLFPPMSHYVVEDVQLLFFDVILLLNLTLSISFWVVHRLQFSYLGGALSEGSLLAILWIGSGLYHGSFLYSAADGGNNSVKEKKTGPGAAGVLAVNTMVTAASLRLIVALGQAIWEHRYALVDGGAGGGESLIPMELGAGFVLMGMWRALHSQYVRRW